MSVVYHQYGNVNHEPITAFQTHTCMHLLKTCVLTIILHSENRKCALLSYNARIYGEPVWTNGKHPRIHRGKKYTYLYIHLNKKKYRTIWRIRFTYLRLVIRAKEKHNKTTFKWKKKTQYKYTFLIFFCPFSQEKHTKCVCIHILRHTKTRIKFLISCDLILVLASIVAW